MPTSALAGAPTRAASSPDTGAPHAQPQPSAEDSRRPRSSPLCSRPLVGLPARRQLERAPRKRSANSASAGYLELSFPAGWRRLASAPTIPGSHLLTVARACLGTAAELRARPASAWSPARSTRRGPSLLPATFTSALSGALPRPDTGAARLVPGATATRADGRGLSGPVTLYTVPTYRTGWPRRLPGPLRAGSQPRSARRSQPR